MGEGLSLGKARDAAFTLTGAGTWFGKPAYLVADPLTIQEGWWTIAQAVAECWTEVRGPGQPHSLLPTPQPFRFHHLGDSPQQMPVWTTSNHPTGCRKAAITIDIEGTRGYYFLSHPHLLWIAGSKVIGVQCWQPHQCHCSQTDWKAPGIPSMADNVGRLEPMWRSIYPSLKMRMQRMPSLIRVGGGTWWYTIMWDVGIAPSFHIPSSPYQGTPEN